MLSVILNAINPYLVERTFNASYILLDVIFISIFIYLLWRNHKISALIVALSGGLLYFLVDYGYFYLICQTRVVAGAPTALFLFWLSMSYGITNMGWMWLWFDDKEHRLEWSIFIITGWLFCAYLSPALPFLQKTIHISRGVGQYHGIMALILFIAYGHLIAQNLHATENERPPAPLRSILICGIMIQLSWESVLLLAGIRPFALYPLLRNSLLETNLGAPIMFMIHRHFSNRKQRPTLIDQPK